MALFEYVIGFITLYVSIFYLLLYFEKKEGILDEARELKRFPPVSFIIPAYNEEKNIASAIESALALDYPKQEIEVIVVDDGSTDATARIARKYASKRVRVYRKENGGKASALNYGIKRARGEFIATLDADSIVEKNSLKKMLALFDRDTMAVTSVIKVREPKSFLEKLQRVEYLLTVFGRRLLSFLDSVYVTPGPLSVFRARVFKELGGFDEKSILEDQEYAMRIQRANYRIKSSIEAVAYTKVPANFFSLLRQRVRWHRGGVRNLLKHHYLISPKYGDLGLFVIPLGIMSIFLVFAIFVFTLYSFVSGFWLDLFRSAFNFNLANIALGITPVHVLSIIILAISVFWAYLGIKNVKGEKVNALLLSFYIIAYSFLVTIFWTAAVFQELKGEKLRW